MKKISFVFMLLLCCSLCSCGMFVDTDTSKSAELKEKYGFYEDSVASIRGGCNVSPEEADDIFLVLVNDCGVDKKIVVTPYTNAPYSVQYGTKTLSMTLDGKTVSEVFDGDAQIYPASKSAAEAEHKNVLLDSKVTEKDVVNGTGDTVIGKYAYIDITDDQLKEMTAADLKEFANTVVDGSDYNWFSIMTPSGTGICFSYSDISSAAYGKLDEDGSILDTSGFWSRDKDGNYSFSESDK